MLDLEARSDDIRAKLLGGEYEFVDFGSSNGGSLKFGFEQIGADSGLGVDKDPRKVVKSSELGYDIWHADVTELQTHPDIVSFVLAFHFLEHLPGFRVGKKCVASAMTAARDFVHIRFPWFDSDGWLFQHGLKFYWSDWRGHDYAMSQLDLYRAIRDADIPCRVRVYGRRPVVSTDDLAIHPITSPIDQHAYRVEMHGVKPSLPIPPSVPTFYELQAVILLSDQYSFDDIEQHLNGGEDNLLSEHTF